MYKILIIILFLTGCSDVVSEEISSELVGNWKPIFLMKGDIIYNTTLELENAFINEQNGNYEYYDDHDVGTITSAVLNFDIKDDYSAHIYADYDILINNVIEQRTEGIIGSWSATEQTFCLHLSVETSCFDYELNNSELNLSAEEILLILEID